MEICFLYSSIFEVVLFSAHFWIVFTGIFSVVCPHFSVSLCCEAVSVPTKLPADFPNPETYKTPHPPKKPTWNPTKRVPDLEGTVLTNQWFRGCFGC